MDSESLKEFLENKCRNTFIVYSKLVPEDSFTYGDEIDNMAKVYNPEFDVRFQRALLVNTKWKEIINKELEGL